jgi:hypothetical protein
MIGRRLLLLVAVLMGLTALAASVAPRQTSDAPPPPVPGRTPTPTATATPELSPATAESEGVIQETMSAAKGASPLRVRARPGQTLQLQVQGAVFDEVQIGGLDQYAAIAPEAPARFELFLDETGRFPVTLVDAGRRLGEIDVRE